MADGVSSRILAAATLAEQHAASMKPGDRRYITLRLSGQELDLERMITAAGPSHWGAVAELLRTMADQHQPRIDDEEPVGPFCSICMPITILYPCPSVAALLPLVDQIIRDLGDGQ